MLLGNEQENVGGWVFERASGCHGGGVAAVHGEVEAHAEVVHLDDGGREAGSGGEGPGARLQSRSAKGRGSGGRLLRDEQVDLGREGEGPGVAEEEDGAAVLGGLEDQGLGEGTGGRTARSERRNGRGGDLRHGGVRRDCAGSGGGGQHGDVGVWTLSRLVLLYGKTSVG